MTIPRSICSLQGLNLLGSFPICFSGKACAKKRFWKKNVLAAIGRRYGRFWVVVEASLAVGKWFRGCQTL